MNQFIARHGPRFFGMSRLEHLPVFDRARARMIMLINACLLVCTVCFIGSIALQEGDGGVQLIHMFVMFIMAVLVACNHELAWRGRLTMAVQALGMLVLFIVTASVLFTQSLTPMIWLLTLTGLVSFFATHPGQVIVMACSVVLCAVLCHVALQGVLPEELSRAELTRVTMICSMIMTLAFLKTRAHQTLSKQLATNHAITVHAAAHATKQRAELLRLLEHARQMDQRKSRFLADMSHELRTPLNAILGYTELLNEEVAEARHILPETICEDVEMIQIASNHLLSLIDEVLDLDEIEHGELRFSPHTFDLVEVIGEVCVAMQHAASRRENKVLFTHAYPTLVIHQDSTLLRQLMFNFVSNAIKFTTHGLIEIELLPITSPRGARVSITDTGKGMSAEDLATLREAFTQSHAQHIKEYGGTGLGLSLCYTIVEVMGGTLDIQSTPGQGTCVTLTLFDIPQEAS